MAIMFLRIRLWLAPGRRRLSRRGRVHSHTHSHTHGHLHGRMRGRARTRRPMAVVFPIALVMATATIVLVARFGGTPRCPAAATVAAGKPQTRSRLRLSQRDKTCPPVLNPLVTGR